MKDEDQIVSRIQKLLALAANNSNENEARAAAAKAQALLEEHNLDMSVVGRTAQGRPRADQRQKGGLYGWQRKLWQSVADLNFCVYWSIKGLERGSTYEHRILGSHANVVSTELMAGYLQGAIDRLAKDWAKEYGYNVFSRDAIAYREGMAVRICERLQQARKEKVEAAKAKREQDAARAQHPNAATSNALTILDVIEDEADLNNDYINGWEAGTTSANRRVREAQQAAATAEWQREQQEQAEWDLAHPEEAAARKEAVRKASEKFWAEYRAKQEKKARRNKGPAAPRYRRKTAEEERADLSAYRVGREKGDEVGLNDQLDRAKNKEIGQ